MKTTATCICILITSISLFAQNEKSDSKVEISLYTQVGSFYMPTKFNTRKFPRCIEGCALVGSAASRSRGIGVEARFKIYKSFNVSSGVSYIKNSYYDELRIGTGGPIGISRRQREFHFINIPVKSHLKLLEPGTQQIYSLNLELGVVNHINLSQQFPEDAAIVELRKYGLSGTISLGIGVSFNKLTVELAPYYQQSLINLGKDTDPNADFRTSSDEAYSPNKFSPRNLGANINFVFGL